MVAICTVVMRGGGVIQGKLSICFLQITFCPTHTQTRTLLPGSGSFSLSGSADLFLGGPPVNGEQPGYHMGAQVRHFHQFFSCLTAPRCMLPSLVHGRAHILICVYIQYKNCCVCVCVCVWTHLNFLVLSLSGRTRAFQKDSIVPERAG